MKEPSIPNAPGADREGPGQPDRPPATAPAERSDAPALAPSAPDGPAPDLEDIQPGDGPGQSPGE